MARHETDREDLYDELSSYAGRWELEMTWLDVPVVAGMRRFNPDQNREDGRLSIYLGPDRVYHFDNENRLRRAYVDGQLFRTQGTTLAVMERHRSVKAITLQRHDLSTAELETFRNECRTHLERFFASLNSTHFTIMRVEETRHCKLATLQERLEDALTNNLPLAPPIAGKR